MVDLVLLTWVVFLFWVCALWITGLVDCVDWFVECYWSSLFGFCVFWVHMDG